MRDRIVRYALPVLGILLLLLLWHFYVVLFNVPPAVLPRPMLVLDSTIANWRVIVQEGTLRSWKVSTAFCWLSRSVCRWLSRSQARARST